MATLQTKGIKFESNLDAKHVFFLSLCEHFFFLQFSILDSNLLSAFNFDLFLFHPKLVISCPFNFAKKQDP